MKKNPKKWSSIPSKTIDKPIIKAPKPEPKIISAGDFIENCTSVIIRENIEEGTFTLIDTRNSSNKLIVRWDKLITEMAAKNPKKWQFGVNEHNNKEIKKK